MLTIDARWVNNSGMGTYLRHVIPGILDSLPAVPITLLGNRDILSGFGWLDRPNVEFVAVNSPMYSLSEQWEVVRCIPRETKLLFYPHYNIPLLYRGTMVVTVYDLCHLALPGAAGNPLKTGYARFFFNAVRKRADAVITISEFTRDEYIRYTGSSTQPIVPIHLAVNETWYEAGKLRQPSSELPYLLYVGNVKPHKNLGALVEAFRLLASRIPHRLVIVGKREGLITADTAVQKAAAELGDRIFFTGFVDDTALKRWVANSEVLVLPSLYEGFGLPPLEAMAARCPVAVSDIAVLKEVCGDAAIYFNPRDPSDIASKLLELATDVGLRDEMRVRGLDRARQFRWDVCVRRNCDLIRDMISTN
jgi:glycosyltransferase involved in cell wall biosynthesis